MRGIKRIVIVLTAYILVSVTGCASVPRETVTLSMMVGQDIEQLQTGYRETIRFSFDQMRQAGLSVIDNVWTPAYLQNFVAKGKLVEAAKDALVAEVDAAFGRVINANAAVTANLNSVLKVQDLHDQLAEALGVSDIRDTINDAIVSASDWAASSIKQIEEAASDLGSDP